MTIGNEVRASIKGTKGNRMFPEAILYQYMWCDGLCVAPWAPIVLSIYYTLAIPWPSHLVPEGLFVLILELTLSLYFISCRVYDTHLRGTEKKDILLGKSVISGPPCIRRDEFLIPIYSQIYLILFIFWKSFGISLHNIEFIRGLGTASSGITFLFLSYTNSIIIQWLLVHYEPLDVKNV